jgi:hypothetical protein
MEIKEIFIMDLTELERQEKKLYVKAYQKGHSVFSIGRSMGFSNMGRVYRVLRDAGVVPNISKRQRFSIPIQLDATFRKCQFSFAQWCNSWKLDVKTAEEAIKIGHWEVKKLEHRQVLAALRHDFHNVYITLYETGNDLDRKYPKDYVSPKLSLWITCDENVGGYIASIPELPGITGVGKNWKEAQMAMSRLYNAQRRISKLETLIEKGHSGEK